MIKFLAIALLLTIFMDSDCLGQKRIRKDKKSRSTVFGLTKNDQPIRPKEYQILLGKGMDVDWVKTRKGMEFYSVKMVKDFKKKGLSHVRLRIQDNVNDNLLKQIDRVVNDCLAENLIPIIAYQGAEFKGKPTEENLNKTVEWWKVVSNFSKKYSHKVAFDLIIEVTEALNKEPEMLNQLYEKTVTEIRKTNPTRIIFISPTLRSAPENLKLLKIPTKHNNFLMAEWHFYASGPDKTNEVKKWTTGTEQEKDLIRKKIKEAKEWQKQTGILTWVGAWMPGNYNKGDHYTIAEQVVFANFVTCELTKNKIPFAFNSDVKFYDRENKAWITETKPVVDEILKTNCK